MCRLLPIARLHKLTENAHSTEHNTIESTQEWKKSIGNFKRMCSYIDKENQISRLLPHDSLYVQCSGFRYPNRRGMIELKTELWQQQQPRHEKWQENPNTNSTNVWNTLSLQKLPSKCLSLFSIFW